MLNFKNDESQQPLKQGGLGQSMSYTPQKPQYPEGGSRFGQGFTNNNKNQYGTNNYEEDEEEDPDYKQIVEGPLHHNTVKHKELIADNIYRECYPIMKRIKHFVESKVRCMNEDDSYVTVIQNLTPIVFNEDDQRVFQNKIIELKIEETNQLELDKNLLHPFVKVHIVDMEKGNYLEKSDFKKDSLLKDELLTWYKDDNIDNDDQLRNKTGGEWKQSYIDYIPPFATNCCDLRINGNSKARWNHTITINEEAAKICDEKNIILFEILDFNPKFLRSKDENKIDKDNFYRVAWGYLRPIGVAGNHFGKVSVQLYKYVFESRILPDNQNKCYVPLVYFDFIWPQKVPYNGQLQVVLNAVPKPQTRRVKDFSKSVFEIEESESKGDLRKSQIGRNMGQSQFDMGENSTEADKKKAKRRRIQGDQCYIPDRVFAKFQSAPLGCFRLEFSHNGRFLAAACTEKNSRTYIKIFDVEDSMEEVFRYHGHKNLIHEISWEETDRFMITCSSDFTAKIWNVPYETNDKISEEQSETQFIVATLNHPSYVYSAKFHPKSNAENLIIVTACFDSKIRIFVADPQARGVTNLEPSGYQLISTQDHIYDDFNRNLLNHRHPNSLSFDGNGKLYVGDSLGMVHIYDLNNIDDNANQIVKINKIENSSIEGDPINQVHYVKPDSLIVHSRDNCLRKFELFFSNKQGQRIVSSYIGSKTQKFPIHSRVSPDLKYVLSGSEDGKPFLWDITGNVETLKSLEYNIEGPVSDVSWSESYHMIAVAGFGDEYPIIVYYFEKDANVLEQEHHFYQKQQQKLQENAQKYDADDNFQQQDVYNPDRYQQKNRY